MYFSTTAGGQLQTSNSPRRSSGGGASSNTSPIRKQFTHYMSLFQQQDQQGRQTPTDKIRKQHQQHLRSSSSNPANRVESGTGLMLHGVPPVGGGGSVTSLSPFHAQPAPGGNNLVAVGTKTKSLSLLIDRGGGLGGVGPEINYNFRRGTAGSLDPRLASSVSGSYNRDQSLERNPSEKREYCTIGGQWERASVDREYPFSFSGAARSLEREHQMRAQSFEGSGFYRDQETPSPAFYPTETPIPSRDSYVLDLQAQIAELNKECAVLQQELDLAKEKLNSTMNSIRSFWSPELKKERSLRKEENLKYSSLGEQLKAVEIENRQHLTILMKLEQENRSLREASSISSSAPNSSIQQSSASAFLQPSATPSTGTGVGESGPHHPPVDSLFLKKERDKHAKEMKLMRKTLDEMELRIETQQKTLSTRDETIKKLMDIFQQAKAKGTFSNESSASVPIEDGSVSKQLESDLMLAREELMKLRRDAETRANQLEASRTQEKLLKDKLEAQKKEVIRKESEVNSLQSRIDTLQRHWNDHEKHISVLREQISSKEQQIKMLHSDVEMLRDRLKEREETLDKKSHQVAHLQNDKTRLNLDLSSLRDNLDESNAKVLSQQRKLETLEECVKERDLQLNSAKLQLTSMQVDHTSSDMTMASLQEMIVNKDRQIEKLKEQRDRMHKEIESEVRANSERSTDLKVKVTQLQDEIMAMQENELTLREEIGRLRSEVGTKDALLSKLSFEENESKIVVEDLQNKLKKSREDLLKASERSHSEVDQRLSAARADVDASRLEVSKVRTELERMVATRAELERELMEMASRSAELEVELSLLRGGRDEVDEGSIRSKHDDLIRRGDDDAAVFKSILVEKDGRIEELEGALRESIKITAQREVVMAELQMKLEHTERLMESMQEDLENTKRSLEESREQLMRSSQQVKEKDDLLREHLNDSKKQLSEVYEMKQEAILAAISEKDAHIALLEMAPNKKLENIQEVEKLTKEKLKLQQVLRDLTQSRMKLLQSRGHMRSSSASSLLHYATHRDAEDDGLP